MPTQNIVFRIDIRRELDSKIFQVLKNLKHILIFLKYVGKWTINKLQFLVLT